MLPDDLRREVRQIVRDGLREVAPAAVAEIEQRERMQRLVGPFVDRFLRWLGWSPPEVIPVPARRPGRP